MLFDFKFPKAMLGGPPTDVVIAWGPFAVERNGSTSFGIGLQRSGDGAQYWDGGRSHDIDPDFTTTLNGDTVIVTNDEYGVKWIFRPLVMEDAKIIAPNLDDGEEVPTDLDALTDTIRELLNNDL